MSDSDWKALMSLGREFSQEHGLDDGAWTVDKLFLDETEHWLYTCQVPKEEITDDLRGMKDLVVQRIVPRPTFVYTTKDAIARLTGNKKARACCCLTSSTIYLTRFRPRDVLHELGHLVLQNPDEEVASRFAEWCEKRGVQMKFEGEAPQYASSGAE
jgi:hypothetical protein